MSVPIPPSTSILDHMEIHPQVDYVSIATPGKQRLPLLAGRPVWPKSLGSKVLVIHDLKPGDVAYLSSVFPGAKVLELEVALDLVPRNGVPHPEREQLIKEAHAWLCRHLHPFDAQFMEEKKTLGFDGMAGRWRPFNYRRPKWHETLYYGLRGDDAQVKVYCKSRDNGMVLPKSEHRTRIEVTLRRVACENHGLLRIEDLGGFAFRKKLSPYFRLISGACATSSRSSMPVVKLVKERLRQEVQKRADAAWERVGVRGSDDLPEIRLRRSCEANQRFGKALGRLNHGFARGKLDLYAPLPMAA